MREGRLITVNSCKYTASCAKHGAAASQPNGLAANLVGRFAEDIEHNDLGLIRKDTVSFEHYWLDRWYNVFRFHQPDGSLKAHYANIAMPPILEGDVLSYVDLDIDVVVWPGKPPQVLDMDDFEKNQVKFDYPTTCVLARCRRSTN